MSLPLQLTKEFPALRVVLDQGTETGTSAITTACTLTGTPFPTTGTCSETYTTRTGSVVSTSTTTYTIPNTSTDILDGLVVETIYTATLTVFEEDVTTASSGPSSSLSTINTGSTTAASEKSVSRTDGSSTVTSTGVGAEYTQGSSTSSHNAAMITGAAPSWMLLAGAIAGVAVGA